VLVGVDVLLELAASSLPDRVALGSRENGITFAQLGERSSAGAGLLLAEGGRSVAFVGVNGPAFNVAVFAAALSGLPITPLNYRLPDRDLCALIDRLDDPVILVDDAMRSRLGARPRMVSTEEWLEATKTAEPIEAEYLDDDAVAAVLFTSGTTSEPKGVVLRHGNLTSYVLQTVELLSAEEDDAALVAVPPYHIAGVATVLTNTYAGRRMVHLPAFDADGWLQTVAAETITHAMVVPTMLARIVEQLETASDVTSIPTLRSIAYGGARIPPSVLERALAAFPEAGFVNAYGLTETSSTIAVLGPDDHRTALNSDDPIWKARLASAGRAVPGIEFAIRDATGALLPVGETGELWVRGAQVAGEYVGLGTGLDAEGWFPTRDRARLDDDGYLFVEGRDDDTIIRGGENIAPAEVEDVLLTHPAVRDAAVIGLPDEEWGQSIAAVIVLAVDDGADPGELAEEVRAHAASRLRSSRAPSFVLIWPELPYTPTGKLLRRTIVSALIADPTFVPTAEIPEPSGEPR
jgi:acyl-CoA synthetase (AMP-forming)/AMP-acid ligase II